MVVKDDSSISFDFRNEAHFFLKTYGKYSCRAENYATFI